MKTYSCQTSEGCTPADADQNLYPRGQGDRAHCTDTRKKHQHRFPQCLWCEAYHHPTVETEPVYPGWEKKSLPRAGAGNFPGRANKGGWVWYPTDPKAWAEDKAGYPPCPDLV